VQEPTHPGLAHYIIHTYDVPALAGQALVAAQTLRADSPRRASRATHAIAHIYPLRIVARVH
jgi:hypothetical protein